MPCTESQRRPAASSLAGLLVALVGLTLAGCSGPGVQKPAPGETRGAPEPIIPAPKPAPQPGPPELVAPSPGAAGGRPPLPAPATKRTWNEVRRQAAERLVAANPDITYTGKVREPLLAIPVLEVELNGDGSIRRIEVMRNPRQAIDTVQIAADAMRRAAPFGDVSRLPRPWKFVETFLFDDNRKFKPRTLDS